MIIIMSRYLLFSVFLFIVSNAQAAPSPFGIEIGKTTYEEVRKKYPGQNIGINKYSKGEMYEIDPKSITVEGIQKIIGIFNEDGIILSLCTKFAKYRYRDLTESLAQKYSLISKEEPFVGNKWAKFLDENIAIIIEAPHMSHSLTLEYSQYDFLKMFDEMQRQETEDKKRKQTNAL